MWYRQAKKYNIFGLPISGDKKFKFFAEEDSEDTDIQETPLEQEEVTEEPESVDEKNQ